MWTWRWVKESGTSLISNYSDVVRVTIVVLLGYRSRVLSPVDAGACGLRPVPIAHPCHPFAVGVRRRATPPLQVGAGTVPARFLVGLRHLRRHLAAGELAHFLELTLGGELLGHQRGLDAVEQAFEPADQLGLRDT